MWQQHPGKKKKIVYKKSSSLLIKFLTNKHILTCNSLIIHQLYLSSFWQRHFKYLYLLVLERLLYVYLLGTSRGTIDLYQPNFHIFIHKEIKTKHLKADVSQAVCVDLL